MHNVHSCLNEAQKVVEDTSLAALLLSEQGGDVLKQELLNAFWHIFIGRCLGLKQVPQASYLCAPLFNVDDGCKCCGCNASLQPTAKGVYGTYLSASLCQPAPM